MGHGFALLIPFSILNMPEVDQCETSQNRIFEIALIAAYMGHRFSILIPFSILSSQKFHNPSLRAEN